VSLPPVDRSDPWWQRFELESLPSPCYLVDAARLRRNGEILARVQRETGCKILLALKGFAMWAAFPILREYLAGTTASSLHELRLGREEFGGEAHIYAPAFREDEIEEIAALADHVVFNTPAQWRRFRKQVQGLSCGLRVNPEHSEVATPLYDPCAPGSRLGTIRAQLGPEDLDGIEGLHFHTLCELNADALERTLPVFEQKFGEFIPQMRWINFGGGHHITRPDYQLERLIKLINDFQQRWGKAVYLEPGEAIALNTGVFISSVLDLHHNALPLAILDCSATCHMPDVLEMPYRPEIIGGSEPGSAAHLYRLGGQTCLAGDVIGDYAFEAPLVAGQKLVFLDMAHYTMVKTTTFNGVRLPAIALGDSASGEVRVTRRFGYEEYRDRLS
jgi:carboxynorspermidine decarboxylase